MIIAEGNTVHAYELILPNGQRYPFKTIDPLPLEIMQALVGGYIEAIPDVGFWNIKEKLEGEHACYCNEDGVSLNLEPNIFTRSPDGDCIIFGNILIDYNPQEEI